AYFAKQRKEVVRSAYAHERDLGYRRNSFLEDLQALPPDFGVDLAGDAGEVATRVRQARRQSETDRLNPNPNDRYRSGNRADRQCDGVGYGYDHVRVAAADDLA